MYVSIYYNYIIPTITKYPDSGMVGHTHEAIYKFYTQLGKICLNILVDTFTNISSETLLEKLTQLNDVLI